MGLDILLLFLWIFGALAGALPSGRFEWLLPPVIAGSWGLTASALRLGVLTVPRHPGGYAVLGLVVLSGAGWSLASFPLREAILPVCSITAASLYLLERRSALQGHVIVLAAFVAAVMGASQDPAARSLPVYLPFMVLLFAAQALIHQQWVLARLRRAAHEGYMLAAQVPGFSGPRRGRWPSMALVVSLTSLMTFALYLAIPHWRWRRPPGAGKEDGSGAGATSGLAERMSLEGVKDLKLDHRVAMRLRLFEEGVEVRPSLPIRLRGNVLERFRGREWDSLYAKKMRRDEADGARDGWVTLDDDPGQTIRILVESDPHGTLLPAPGRPARVKLPQVYVNTAGVVSMTKAPGQKHTWEMDCDISGPRPGSYETWPRHPDAIHVQLPARDPDVERLAKQVAGDAGSAWETAVRIESHLRNEYAYSLEVDLDEEPIHALLFESKSGYCVHFAAAMAVMLRHLDIPCRIAQGMYGGDWNDREQLTIFRLSDAHAWVEVWMGERAGWVAFDPTPADGAPPAEDGEFSLSSTAPEPDGTPRPEPTAPALSPTRLSNLNLGSQTRWINAVADWAASLWGRRGFRGILLGLLLLVSIVVTWHLLPRHEQARLKALVGSASAASAFYDEFLTLAARAGYRPAKSETPLEFGRRVERSYPEAARVAMALYAVRFGGDASGEQVRAVRPILDAIRAAQAGKKAAAEGVG